MPKIGNTRQERATQLRVRLARGPQFSIKTLGFRGVDLAREQREAIAKEIEDGYRQWAETWVLDELDALVPELRHRKRPHRVITEADVGQGVIEAFGCMWVVADFIGRILPGDVGKRIYRVADRILQVENDQQRSDRLAIEKASA